MPEIPDLKSLSDEELEAWSHELQAQRTAIGDLQDLYAAERDDRAGKAQAKSILEGMSPGEIDILIEAATAKAGAGAEQPKTPGEGS